MRVSHASRYAQPLSRPVLIADENSFHVSIRPDALIQAEHGVVCRSQAEEVVVAFEESVKPDLQTMPARRRCRDRGQAAVMRAPVVALNEWLIFRTTQELAASEVI